MATYVDSAFIKYGRMLMCHLLADSTEELLATVDIIGVNRKWLQNPGTATEHFDICKAKRELAIANGAIIINNKELVALIRAKRVNKTII